jgi:hypothetical protein
MVSPEKDTQRFFGEEKSAMLQRDEPESTDGVRHRLHFLGKPICLPDLSVKPG